MPNTHIAYFGYGSLVNRTTHQTDIADFTPARLKGWRRQWLPRPWGVPSDVALLSVTPHPECEIDGLVVTDFARNLPALDVREKHYDRHELPPGSIVDPVNSKCFGFNGEAKPKASVYVASKLSDFKAREECKILRSYLDTVMQGYLNKFGREGVLCFIASTDNFEIGIHEDRANPRYPRSVSLSASERKLFDQLVPNDN